METELGEVGKAGGLRRGKTDRRKESGKVRESNEPSPETQVLRQKLFMVM